MELLDRQQQAARKHLPLRRQNDIINRHQPQQYVIGPPSLTYWLAPPTALYWAIIIYSIVATMIAFAPLNQNSVVEATLHGAGILIRCFFRLSVDGERILSELIADWHFINASIS
jgi:hypothetical protein